MTEILVSYFAREAKVRVQAVNATVPYLGIFGRIYVFKLSSA